MGIVRQIRHVTGGYTSAQVKVRDATANDTNAPNRMLMQEIADLTYDSHEMVLIMDMIDKRLNDKGKYWRHVQKALVLLDYLVHVGSDRVVLWCNENLYVVKTLREFHYRDDTGRDVGGPIRDRAVRLTSLLMNTEELNSERARFARGGGTRGRYRRRSRQTSPDSDRYDAGNDEDDELARVLQLSKETAAAEEERRRMAGASGNDLQAAQDMSAQNQMDMMGAWQQQQQQLAWQQQQEEAALAQAQREYFEAQQQAQFEAQRLYEMQLAQSQQDAYQQQLLQQQMQQQQAQQAPPPMQEPLQPLKTGSNNPFAAFNAKQAEQKAQRAPVPASPSAAPVERQRLHRQSTFDREHMDKLDSVLNPNAMMDTFGNTGSALIPAQHTANDGFVDSSGRGLTAMLTNRQKTGQKTGSTNPFSAGLQNQQYTGIASTQMQPAHTGFGFGNANHSSTNLIDL